AVDAKDLSFRIEDVAAGRMLELTLHPSSDTRPVWAAARALVPNCQTVEVDLHATVAGRVVLSTAVPMPRRVLALVTTDQIAWRPTCVLQHRAAGSGMTAEIVWPAGPTRWQARFIQEYGAAVLRGELEFTLAAEERREIALPLR